MNKFIKVISGLKYIGLIGLPYLFSKNRIWMYFWLFWIFGILELILTLPMIIQAVKQVLAIPYVKFRYRFHLPDVTVKSSKVQYSLPFEGKWTAINGGVEKNASHSWIILSQRYAYDFVILDEDGNSSKDKIRELEKFYCYKKEVLAPADGIVIQTQAVRKNSEISKYNLPDSSVTDIRGNFIIIKHAENEYSFLAHLLPGSICVKPGDHVKRGDVIALCGNSGNTTEPHIHFQVQDTKSFFYSMGIPIQFKNICFEEAKNYSKFDSRQVPKTEKYEFIHRGLAVENKDNEIAEHLG